MAIWAISDLHLSLARDPEGKLLGPRWAGHKERIENNWRSRVKDDDLVLLPGDVSMARTHKDVQPDLRWLHELPGTKVLSPGNHDLWWNNLDKVRIMMRSSQLAVNGDAVETHGVIVCGARGMPPIDLEKARDGKEAIAYAKELEILEKALIKANALRTNKEPVYLLWHYPPFDAYGRPGPCVAHFEAAWVSTCVYGHIHAESQWSSAPQGTIRAFVIVASRPTPSGSRRC